ncbi:DegT/DnrJ/EryC1/StrS family aminotransferase [candidate division KSB1 bacterium]|nr:DegT/DnrJ/EryC1/StrS family aminotransferase [candidate division KSB1 bacterium]
MNTLLALDFPAIQTHLSDHEIDELAKFMREAKTLTMGPQLQQFEQEFAAYLNIPYAFGVSNASCALELTAMILEIKPDAEILLPAHTFTATALPFLRAKAKLVFVDLEPDTFVMDPDDLKRKITNQSRVIVPVHLYGLPVKMDEIMKIARQHSLWVVEDCAQSPGAEYNGQKVGTFGDFGCFSFHSQKNLTTLGEGGMLVTPNRDFARKIQGLRKIGQRPYEQQEKYWLPAMTNIIEAVPGAIPYNFALSEIQALAGRLILKRIDALNEKRRQHYSRITEALSQHPELQFQKFSENTLSACHLLPARYNGQDFGKSRNDLIELLYSQYKIKCVVQYQPLYRYELFQRNGYQDQGLCPETNAFYDNIISFPFSSDLTDDEINYLIQALDKALTSLKE